MATRALVAAAVVGGVLGVFLTLAAQAVISGSDPSSDTAVEPSIDVESVTAVADTTDTTVTTSSSTSTSSTTTTTTTTTLPATDPEDAVLYAPISGAAEANILEALTAEFGEIAHFTTNHDGLAIVEDPTGDATLRFESTVGTDGRTQFSVPIDAQNETYLVYRFLLEPGFDAGDGNEDEGAPVWGTGVKMPGLMRGDARDNTGGNHTEDGFSGRLMIRGTRKSDGRRDLTREGLTLSAYVYGQEYEDQDIATGFGTDFYFLDGFETRPFTGVRNGVSRGVGDPAVWDLPVGEWVTVVLGYRIDGDDGWFKAWTMVDGQDDVPVPRLQVDGLNWTGGFGAPDALLFQQYWGGSGSVWYPDTVSYIQYRDFAVFDDEWSALLFAGT